MKPFTTANAQTHIFHSVDGTFYRTVDPAYKSSVITGSRLAGRYSSVEQPTLYLSATLEGMAAAIGVHKANRSTNQEVIAVKVVGGPIFDLRNKDACKATDINLNDAVSPWQQQVAQLEGRRLR